MPNNIRIFRVSPALLIGKTQNEVINILKLNNLLEKDFDLEIENGKVIRAIPLNN